MDPEPALQRALEDARDGRLDAALASVRRVVARQPKSLGALQVMGQLLMQAGQSEQAAHFLSRAIALSPVSPSLRNDYALALFGLKKTREAIEQLRRAVTIDPGYADGWMGLACALMEVPDAEGAIAAARRGLELRPDDPDMVNNLAASLGMAGRIEEVAALAERGHLAHPHHTTLHSLHLMMLNYSDRPGAAIAGAHREFGTLHPPTTPSRSAGWTDPDPDRTLRIGWLSTDLRTHSVAYFAEPLLRFAPADVESCVFSLQPSGGDPLTQRLRSLARSWEEVAHLNPAALDRTIRERRIDVLIETNGHTPGNRLTVLCNRPAPIMVSAIGYPNTTGLSTVDYRLVDSLTDPPGAEALATERLLRLDPCFLCYQPPADAPEPSMPGVGAALTFGSFNTPTKIGARTIALWKRAMDAVPGSRLLVKATHLNEEPARAYLLGKLARGGIDGERTEIMAGASTVREHLAIYSRVHIALDTAPYQGTTTTCEALWMGVPVVSLEGDRHVSRVSTSLLSAVGKPEWVARIEEQYATIAAGLAGDLPTLGALRGSLRGTMKASVLCDGEGYAKRFYAAVRACWRQWCGANASSPQAPSSGRGS